MISDILFHALCMHVADCQTKLELQLLSSEIDFLKTGLHISFALKGVVPKDLKQSFFLLGLVMFGDIDEMYQALAEMNGHNVLCETDHPAGALMSVVQHVLKVQIADVSFILNIFQLLMYVYCLVCSRLFSRYVQ